MKKRTTMLMAILGCLALCGCGGDDKDNGGNVIVNPGGNNEVKTYCGNKTCDPGETKSNCPQDCSVCGDGTCDAGEDCPADCKAVCGDGFCMLSRGESYDNCPNDKDVVVDGNTVRGDCAPEKFCGDFVCSPGEEATCRYDCPLTYKVNDGECETQYGENSMNSLSDCRCFIGDGICDELESICSEQGLPGSERDCGLPVIYEPECGDGFCEDSEKKGQVDYCAQDCETVVQARLNWADYNALSEHPYHFLFDFDTVVQLKALTSEDDDAAFKKAMNDFFAFPYPSAMRTNQYGRPLIAKYPLPQNTMLDSAGAILTKFKTLLPSLLTRIEGERKGFSPLGAVYFRASAPIEKPKFPTPEESMEKDSCFQLVNVSKESAHYKEHVPVYVTYHHTPNRAWATDTLVMRPVPGLGPHPGDMYIAVVGNCMKTNGRPFLQSQRLRYVLDGKAPYDENDYNYDMDGKMKPYVDALKELIQSGDIGMSLDDIRAFTGYQVSNPASEMDQIAADLVGKGKVVTVDGTENGVAKGAYATTTKYSNDTLSSYNAYVFTGQFQTVNYIEGNYPYDTAGSGVINFSDSGKLATKGKSETVNFAISIPNAPMPEKGYPIIVYAHGTGGDAASHCEYGGDEGFWLTSNGVPVAMIGYDACLQGNRGNGGTVTTGDLVTSMLNDPIVIRESWRQTAADAAVLYDILKDGKLVLPPLPGSTDGKNVIFDPSYGLYMGHSQGSQEGAMLLGITDQVKSAFLSAGGGGVYNAFVELRLNLTGALEMFSGKTVADLVGYLLGMNPGDITYDTFITTQIVQPLTDPLEPLNFSHRYIKEPPEGRAPMNIAQTIGLGDRDTPQSLQFTFGAAIGLPVVGKLFESNDIMRIVGNDKPVASPQTQNITSGDTKVTGGTFQFRYTGSDNPHFVIYRMASGRSTYLNFFRSILDGNPTVRVDGSQEGDM